MRAWAQGIGWILGDAAGSAQGGRRADVTRIARGPLSWGDVSRAPFPRFGRLGLLAKYAVAAAALAGCRPASDHRKTATAIVLTTASGVLSSDAAFLRTLRRDEGPSPLLFPYSLPTAALGEVSLRYGFTGPADAEYADGDLLGSALQAGLARLAAGTARDVLVLACEANDPDVLAAFGLAEGTHLAVAVRLTRDGLVESDPTRQAARGGGGSPTALVRYLPGRGENLVEAPAPHRLPAPARASESDKRHGALGPEARGVCGLAALLTAGPPDSELVLPTDGGTVLVLCRPSEAGGGQIS